MSTLRPTTKMVKIKKEKNMKENKNFIKEKREQLGISQRELAKNISMSQSGYSRIELGGCEELRVCDLNKILELFYGKSVDIFSIVKEIFEINSNACEEDFIVEDKDSVINFLNEECENRGRIIKTLREENQELCDEIVQLHKEKEDLKNTIKNLANIL